MTSNLQAIKQRCAEIIRNRKEELQRMQEKEGDENESP